ncbi:MAG: anti-sigma factor [Pseudomonadota bacterium]
MNAEEDLDAAERALGHAPRFGEKADARQAREAWEARLAPLLDAAEPVAPPDSLWQRIETVIGAESGQVIALDQARAQTRLWKGISGVALAAAAALAIYVAVPATTPTEAAQYVAVVTADDGSGTGLIIQFDTASGVATVIPAGASPPDGSSYEMWHLPQGATQPVSLGLLPQDPVARTTITAGTGDLFAISLEPPGGSPTGQPTQPLYHGTVVRVE